MHIHSFHYVLFEGLGIISKWLQQKGFRHSAAWLNDKEGGSYFPSQSDFDALIIMGGPMRVHDDVRF